jgi:hypothetical protein
LSINLSRNWWGRGATKIGFGTFNGQLLLWVRNVIQMHNNIYFCEIIVTLPSFQLPSSIAPSFLLSCNGKQFGVLRQAVDNLVQMEESGRRSPNNPHIEVMLQYYRKLPCRNKFKYDYTDSKWIDVDCVYCNHELQSYK